MPLNLPIFLTLCRFVMIPVYIAVFASGYVKAAFAVVLLAGLTDILDGYLARRNGQVTEIGKMLDPLADKTMMLVVILSLLYKGYISWYAAAAVLLRDVGMIVGGAFFHFRGKKTVPANVFGKLTTVLYYLAFLFLFFEFPYAETCLWFVILFSFLTSIIYIVRARAINRTAALEGGRLDPERLAAGLETGLKKGLKADLETGLERGLDRGMDAGGMEKGMPQKP